MSQKKDEIKEQIKKEIQQIRFKSSLINVM